MPVQENFQEKDAYSPIQFFYFYLLLLHHGHKPFSGMKLLIRFKPYSKKGNQSGVKSRGFYAWLCIKLLCDWINTDFPGLSLLIRRMECWWRDFIMWGTLKLPSKLTAAMPCLKTSCKSGSIKWIFFHFFFSKWVLWQFSIYFFKESLHFPCKWLKVTHWYSKQGIC